MSRAIEKDAHANHRELERVAGRAGLPDRLTKGERNRESAFGLKGRRCRQKRRWAIPLWREFCPRKVVVIGAPARGVVG